MQKKNKPKQKKKTREAYTTHKKKKIKTLKFKDSTFHHEQVLTVSHMLPS